MPTTLRSNQIDTSQNSSIDTDLQSIIDAIADVATQSTLQVIETKLPALISGKIPVDVASLNVTVDNTSLEISNDDGSPIPVSGTVSVGNFPASQTVDTGLTQPLTDTQLRASAVPVVSELSSAVMLEVPPVDLGTAGTVQAVAFTDIVSLEIKPRSNTTIHYTFDVDGFTNNTYKVLVGTGQSFEYGQAGKKFTGNLYLRDPINDNTLVELAGFF